MGEAEGFSREGNQHLPPRAAGIDGAESPSSGVKGYCTKGCPLKGPQGDFLLSEYTSQSRLKVTGRRPRARS